MRAVSRSVSVMMGPFRCAACLWPSTPTSPTDVRVMQAQQVPEDFPRPVRRPRQDLLLPHPQQGAVDDPFDAEFTHRVPKPLDEQAMQRAAAGFVGTHDFLALCASGSSVAAHGDTVRTITRCDVTRDGEVFTITVTADGYLYNMVRILRGALLQAGLGKLDPAQVPAILQSRDRRRAGPTLPANGLCLADVQYPGLVPETDD